MNARQILISEVGPRDGLQSVKATNFKPGTMKKLGLDRATLTEKFPRLIYGSHTGLLPGPYEHRTVQMMGGLAYMTGRAGDPLPSRISARGQAMATRFFWRWSATSNGRFFATRSA